jgi:hypothetical protein
MKPRQQWIAMLAKLTAPMNATTAAQAFAAYLPMLTDFPDAAFCDDSLKAVAAECGYAPSYGALRKALGTWWKQHRPLPTALPEPPPPTLSPPTDAERAAVNRTVGQILAGIHEVSRQREAEIPHIAQRPMALHLSREQLNAMYRRDGLVGPQAPAGPPLPANDPQQKPAAS